MLSYCNTHCELVYWSNDDLLHTLGSNLFTLCRHHLCQTDQTDVAISETILASFMYNGSDPLSSDFVNERTVKNTQTGCRSYEDQKKMSLLPKMPSLC